MSRASGDLRDARLDPKPLWWLIAGGVWIPAVAQVLGPVWFAVVFCVALVVIGRAFGEGLWLEHVVLLAGGGALIGSAVGIAVVVAGLGLSALVITDLAVAASCALLAFGARLARDVAGDEEQQRDADRVHEPGAHEFVEEQHQAEPCDPDGSVEVRFRGSLGSVGVAGSLHDANVLARKGADVVSVEADLSDSTLLLLIEFDLSTTIARCRGAPP